MNFKTIDKRDKFFYRMHNHSNNIQAIWRAPCLFRLVIRNTLCVYLCRYVFYVIFFETKKNNIVCKV